jgi:hypothetical protein
MAYTRQAALGDNEICPIFLDSITRDGRGQLVECT